ncbi:hypothetical protein ACISK3_04540 [Morganella morganii]|nr:hypothetical protein [Morganella morganii]
MAITAEDIKTGLGHIDTIAGAGALDGALAILDEKIMAAERTKIAQSVKKMYATYISQALSIKTHTAVMISADSAQRRHLDREVIGGKNLLEETADYYEKGRSRRTYRIMRKAADTGRVRLKQNLASGLTAPLALIPDGGISKMVASCALTVMEQGKSIRRSRKIKHYRHNKKEVAAETGEAEAQRKSAKWSCKTLSKLGGDLQRNLYKLKQSVVVLQSRGQSTQQRIDQVSAHSHNHPGSHDLSMIRGELTDLAMSFHESLHYVEKVTNMCTLLDAASCEIKAHMANMLELLELTESTLMSQGDEFFR